MQLLSPLRDRLQDEGFAPVFECEDTVCGGYDFCYRMDVLPEPDMHVNLGDYRYLVARRAGDRDEDEYVGLIVSRSANAGFVQVTHIGAPTSDRANSTSTKAPGSRVVAVLPGPIGQQLESMGHASLNDLYFEIGSSKLGADKFTSLAGLADYLTKNPDRTVVLVGHTDADGALDSNIALSRRRAAAVVTWLIRKYDIPADQISADGVGYLAPRTSNLTNEGRTRNRRVEAILTSTR